MADEDELGLAGGSCPCSCPAPPSGGGHWWEPIADFFFGSGTDDPDLFQDPRQNIFLVAQVNAPSVGAGFRGGRTGTAVGAFSRDYVPAQQQDQWDHNTVLVGTKKKEGFEKGPIPEKDDGDFWTVDWMPYTLKGGWIQGPMATGLPEGKYPPAKLGALRCEPLKAA